MVYDASTSKWKNGGARVRGVGLQARDGLSGQTVVGKYNDDTNADLFEIGIGTDANNRHNAFTISQTGLVLLGGSKYSSGDLQHRFWSGLTAHTYYYSSGEQFAYVESGSTASRDYKRGQLIQKGSNLYVVQDDASSQTLDDTVITTGDTFTIKSYSITSGYNLIPAAGRLTDMATHSQVGILNILRDVWGSLFEKASNKSNVQVNSTDKYPSSALVYAMNQNLGDPSSASAVTGADAFSKIGQLNSQLTNKASYLSSSSTATNIGTSITAGQTYSVPADGFYTLRCFNNDTNHTRSAEFTINGGTLVANNQNFAIYVVIPLKKGTIVSTRANVSGTDDFQYVIVVSFT